MVQPPDNTDDKFGSIPIAGGEAPPGPEQKKPPAPPQPPPSPRSRAKHKKRSFPWKTLFIGFPVFAFAVYLLIGFLLIPYLVTTKFAEELSGKIGRPVTIADANFNPLTLSLTLFNGIVGARLNDPHDQVDPVLSFSRLAVDFEALSLIKQAVILKKLEADQFFLHVVRFQDGSYNVIKMLHAKGAEEGESLTFLLPGRFSLNNISLVDSSLVFDDQPSGAVHTIEEINLALPSLSNFAYKTKQYINPKFSAKINGSPIEMTGESTVESGTLSARLDLHLKKLDLPSYLAYLPVDFNFTVTNGLADLDLGLLYSTSPAAAPQLQIEGTGSLSDVLIKDAEGNVSRVPKAKIAGSVSPLVNQYNLQELALTSPEIKIDKSPAGRWSFTGSPKKSTRKDSGSDKSVPAAVKIDRLQVTDGKVSIIDRHVEGGFSETLSDFQLSVTSFNNNDGKKAPFALSAKSAKGMRISAQGSIYPSPVKAEGLLVIDQLDLTRLTPYFAMRRDLGIHSGLANKISTRFVLERDKKDQGLAVSLVGMEMQLKDLTLAKKSEEWLRLPDLTIKEGSVASAGRTINFGNVSGAKGYLLLNWDKKGVLNWEEHAGNTSSAKGKWNTTFQSFEFSDATVAIKADGAAGPFETQLSAIDVKAQITDVAAREGNVKGTAQINGTGALQFAGPISVDPFKAELTCTAKNVQLNEVQSLTKSWFAPTMKSGVMQANGTLTLPGFDFAGEAGVQSFSAASPQTPNLVRWQNAIVHDLHLRLNPFSLKIASINVEKPYLNWTLFEKERSSLSKMFLHGTPSPRADKPPNVDIAEVRLSDGELAFTDQIVSPPYSTTIQAISGSVANIQDQAGSKTRFKLQGMVAGSSPISLDGDFGFFGTTLLADFSGQVAEMSITPLMPYIEPLIGYQIRKGQLTMHTTYKQQDQQITADNAITIQNFELGQRTDGNAQLPLAVALNMGADKTVKLDIPINGDIADADFSFKNSFVKVIRNLLIKTAVSPFALLASFVPEQEQPINRLIFKYGAASFTEDNKKQLALLADILKKRPYLKVQINGFADSVCDREAIVAKHQQEEAQRRLEREARLSAKLSETYGKEEIEVPELPKPAASGAATEQFTLPEKAITEALNVLANQRSKLVRQQLVDELGIAPDRVQIGKTRIQSSKEPPEQCASRVDFTLDTLLK